MNKHIWTYINVWASKIRCINYLGGSCKHCGNTNIFHLVFHHTKDKLFTFGKNRSIPWSKLKPELDKCILLCENCHMEHHFNERNSNDKRRKTKLIYLEYTGTKCERCNYDKSSASLSFHHKDPNIKSFWLGSNTRINSIDELDDTIIKELDKCEVICRNCHLEEHIDIEKFNTYKTEIYYKVENFKEISSKLSRNDVIKMYEDGMKQIDIAKHFNTVKSTICGIIKEYKNGK
jgi:hypothetical protein